MKRVTSIASGAIMGIALLSAPAAAGGLVPIQTGQPGCARFDGAYVGGNIGWAYNETDWTDRDAWVDNFSKDWALGTVSTNNDGVTGGVQGGYNLQRNCTLFGIEADINWADLGSSKTYDPGNITDPVFPAHTVLSLNHDVNYWGTIRGRTGVIVDNLLLYVTGGLAYADIDHNWTISDVVQPSQSFSINDVRWGGVGGVGTELAINDWMTLRSELLYLALSEESTTGVSQDFDITDTVNFDSQDDMWVGRVGLNILLNPLMGGQ